MNDKILPYIGVGLLVLYVGVLGYSVYIRAKIRRYEKELEDLIKHFNEKHRRK